MRKPSLVQKVIINTQPLRPEGSRIHHSPTSPSLSLLSPRRARPPPSSHNHGRRRLRQLRRLLQRRLSQSLLRRVHLHPPLHLRRRRLRHRLWQVDVGRGPRPRRPRRRGHRPRVRPLRHRVHRRQHLRRTRQPGCHLRAGSRRPDHHPHRHLLLGRPARRRRRRSLPPQVRHRPQHTNPRPCVRSRSHRGSGLRDYHHVRPRLHRVRHRCRPQEGLPRHHRPDRHRPDRRRQHPRRRPLLRRVHEPGPLLRSRGRQRRLHRPLGLLGRPPHRRRLGRNRVHLRLLEHRPPATPPVSSDPLQRE